MPRLQPLLPLVDCFFFDAYRGAETYEQRLTGVKQRVELCPAYAPEKPVYILAT